MPHFLINSNKVKNSAITIDDSENYSHIAVSLRAKPGESLLLIDENEVQYETVIENISKKEIHVKILKKYNSIRKTNFKITLAQCILKQDAQNLTIQKATELGVHKIIPVISDNVTVKKEIISQKLEKWQKIAKEAFKQCERANIPKVENPISLQELLLSKDFDEIIIFAEKEADFTLKEYLSQNKTGQNNKILAVIGPEGGFSDSEFDFFKQNRLAKVSLSNLILKAETASICAISNLIYGLEK